MKFNGSIITVILFGGILMFLTWIIDVRGLQTQMHQHDSESFPHVQGTVQHSEVIRRTGSKGRVYYHPSITYRYTIDGVDYTRSRYRYDGNPNDWTSANSIVAAHPIGAAVNVYYNPQDPKDAVLSTPVAERDLGLILALSPLNLFFLWGFLQSLQQMDWGRTPVAGGVKVISEMTVTRLRLPRFQPLAVGLFAVGAVLLLAGILLSVGELRPPWDAAGWSFAAALFGGAVAYAWHYRNVHSGRQDLIIDEGGRTFQLPHTYKRVGQKPVPFSEIRSVLLNKVRHHRRGGDFYTYVVVLELKDNSQQKLIDLNKKRADSLAAWLEEKFALSGPAMTINPENED